MSRRTLTAALARAGAFSKHGELLCTLGLCHLLGEPDVSTQFASFLGERCGIDLPKGLHWIPEATQTDLGRPDIEGRSGRGPDAVPGVKVEAKLNAEFGPAQGAEFGHGSSTRMQGLFKVGGLVL